MKTLVAGFSCKLFFWTFKEGCLLCSLKEGTLNWEMLQFKSKFPREVLLCRVCLCLSQFLWSLIRPWGQSPCIDESLYNWIPLMIFMYDLNVAHYFLVFSRCSGWRLLWIYWNRCLYSCWICRFEPVWWYAIRQYS